MSCNPRLAPASVTIGLTVLLIQAFRQLPLDQLPRAALGTLAVCVVALLAAYAVIVAALLQRASSKS